MMLPHVGGNRVDCLCVSRHIEAITVIQLPHVRVSLLHNAAEVSGRVVVDHEHVSIVHIGIQTVDYLFSRRDGVHPESNRYYASRIGGVGN